MHQDVQAMEFHIVSSREGRCENGTNNSVGALSKLMAIKEHCMFPLKLTKKPRSICLTIMILLLKVVFQSAWKFVGLLTTVE